jgi:hypothetical protein
VNPSVGAPGHGQLDRFIYPQGDPQGFFQPCLDGVDSTLLFGPAPERGAVVLDVETPVQRRM